MSAAPPPIQIGGGVPRLGQRCGTAGLHWLYVDADSIVFARESVDDAVVLARRAPGSPVRLAGRPPTL